MMLRNLAVDFKGFCGQPCLKAVERAIQHRLSTAYCPGCHRQITRAETDLGTWTLVERVKTP